MNDPELPYAIAFLIFGIGFFIFVLHYVHRADDSKRERMAAEAREFGYDGSRLQKEAKNHRTR